LRNGVSIAESQKKQPMLAPEPTAYILAGATATGKSATAQCCAEQLGAPILSADSMLVYQGMDIGTAKPSPRERGTVPYSGLDLVTPAEPFSTGRWLEAARDALDNFRGSTFAKATADRQGPVSRVQENLCRELCRSSKLCASAPLREKATPLFIPRDSLPTATANCHCPPIVVGGTGLYIKALTDGIESSESSPELRAKWQALFEQEGLSGLQEALRLRAPDTLKALSDTTNPRRLLRALEQLERDGSQPQQWKTKAAENAPIIVLTLPREQLHRRIAKRVDQMFDAGLLEEVRALREAYPAWSSTASKAIGYEEALALLDGNISCTAAREQIIIRTRQLAKRQETWFRHQANAHWLQITENEHPEQIAQRVLDLWRTYGPTRIRIPGA
jgi:tRNA dimethylallyltransferase